jgi:hypothetical protein
MLYEILKLRTGNPALADQPKKLIGAILLGVTLSLVVQNY